ncbi:MAG TPA: protein kinase [Candidatus Binatus sp.]|jgi:serine/threonine protein kinase|nr:protein kinase [Candidatus Binatus sp.]
MKYCPACNKTYPGDYNVCPADQTGLQNTHEFQPGMIIRNKYQILDRIGVGGMGVVYRGRHLTFNEVCAIKIVSDAIAGDANFLQRFQTEAVVTRKLRHPNAVRVDDFDYTEDGRPFIVMELVEGKNIGEILHAEGPFRVPRALRIASQIASALGVAHKLGVVHRDIKPANILLATDEHGQEVAKVLDFGIAKLREVAGEAQPGMTMTGMVVGTPLYMSPEQFMGKKAAGEIDGRTDIYSLGVVLYQMVTAQLPFDGDTPYSLMMQHMQGTVRPPHELAPDLHIPESLSQVILKAIDKSRELRFQTAEEFIAALDEVTHDPLVEEQAASEPAPKSIPQNDLSPSGQRPSVPVPRRTLPNLTAPPSVPVAQPSASQVRATRPPAAQSRPSQIASTLPMPQSSVGANVSTPKPAPAFPATVPMTPPALTPPSRASRVNPAPPAGSAAVNSAAQHVFVPPRKFQLKQIIALVVLLLAAVLVAGVGYVKYQAYQRVRIENAINARFNAVPALHQADLRVFVSDKREVTLDGKVGSKDDFIAAGDLAASVRGVTSVVNRVEYPPAAQAMVTPIVPVQNPQSFITDGNKSMDDGRYADAIASFTKAVEADPNNQATQELLTRARTAQQTEEQLLKNRHLP